MYKTKIISSCTTYVNFINTLSHLSFGIRRSTYKLVRIVFKFLYYFCIMYQPEDIPTLLHTSTQFLKNVPIVQNMLLFTYYKHKLFFVIDLISNEFLLG